jgi:hypothetical protein
MVGLDELKVPKTVRPVAEEIVAITDAVCLAVLDGEYADLARRAVAKLARKRPSPLLRGRRTGWGREGCMRWVRSTSCSILRLGQR